MKFTKAENSTILNWIEKNIEEGYYYGNKEQYFKRLEKIQSKLEDSQSD